jgi:hypothetical protein
MERVIRAPPAGRVVAFLCAIGDQVSEGAELLSEVRIARRPGGRGVALPKGVRLSKSVRATASRTNALLSPARSRLN